MLLLIFQVSGRKSHSIKLWKQTSLTCPCWLVTYFCIVRPISLPLFKQVGAEANAQNGSKIETDQAFFSNSSACSPTEKAGEDIFIRKNWCSFVLLLQLGKRWKWASVCIFCKWSVPWHKHLWPIYGYILNIFKNNEWCTLSTFVFLHGEGRAVDHLGLIYLCLVALSFLSFPATVHSSNHGFFTQGMLG